MMKNCNCCKIDKYFLEFYKKKGRTGLSGYSSSCKECVKIKKAEYYENNKEYIGDKNKEYKENNKDYYFEYNKIYRENNKERLDSYAYKWREENKEEVKSKRAAYYQENKEEIKKKSNLYIKEKMKTDSLFKLTRGIRSLILLSFKNQFTEKSKRTTEILGCSFEEFKIYLESMFDENMNWDNQGIYWHMDHIKPISLASKKKEVYELNHYTNFQPLYWKDNLTKSNKY